MQENKDAFANLLNSDRGTIEFLDDFNQEVADKLRQNDIFRWLNLKINIFSLDSCSVFVEFLKGIDNPLNLHLDEVYISNENTSKLIKIINSVWSTMNSIGLDLESVFTHIQKSDDLNFYPYEGIEYCNQLEWYNSSHALKFKEIGYLNSYNLSIDPNTQPNKGGLLHQLTNKIKKLNIRFQDIEDLSKLVSLKLNDIFSDSVESIVIHDFPPENTDGSRLEIDKVPEILHDNFPNLKDFKYIESKNAKNNSRNYKVWNHGASYDNEEEAKQGITLENVNVYFLIDNNINAFHTDKLFLGIDNFSECYKVYKEFIAIDTSTTDSSPDFNWTNAWAITEFDKDKIMNYITKSENDWADDEPVFLIENKNVTELWLAECIKGNLNTQYCK